MSSLSGIGKRHGQEKLPPLPVWSSPLPVFVHVEKQLWGVNRWGGAGIQKQLFMLGEVLGRVLFGQSCAVKELALQQGQVGLQEHDRDERREEKSASDKPASLVRRSDARTSYILTWSHAYHALRPQTRVAGPGFPCVWLAPHVSCLPLLRFLTDNIRSATTILADPSDLDASCTDYEYSYAQATSISYTRGCGRYNAVVSDQTLSTSSPASGHSHMSYRLTLFHACH